MALGSFPPLLLLRSSSNSALLWPLLPSTKSAKWKKETRNYSAERSSNDEIEMRNQRWEKKREAREWNNTSLRPTMSSTLCSNIVQQRLKRSSGSRAEGLTSLHCSVMLCRLIYLHFLWSISHTEEKVPKIRELISISCWFWSCWETQKPSWESRHEKFKGGNTLFKSPFPELKLEFQTD